ncbi:hypothetical protein BDN67DRAFT_873952, partial [Paxillus ammoniavirescens]
MGMTLAVQLLTLTKYLEPPIAIYIDNQAVNKSSEVFETKPRHYLMVKFCRTIMKLRN